MFYLISLTEPSLAGAGCVLVFLMPLPFFQRFCGGFLLLLSFLSKWTVLLRSESTYGLVSELDRISPSQTENKFDLSPIAVLLYYVRPLFAVPDNTLGMFYSFSVTFKNNNK